MIEGQIADDVMIPRMKDEYIRLLTQEMKATGYAIRIDINPDFTIQYNHEKHYYEFKITAYGIHVGKKNSEWISGIDEYRPIYTQKSKSSESYQEQESQ